MKKIAFIFLIIAGIFWGTSGIFVHLLSPYGFSALQMIFLRSVVSFLIMLIYILIKDKRLLKLERKDFLWFAGSGIALFGTAGCYYAAMIATSIPTAVVLMYIAPVLVMIYSVAFLGETLTKLKAVSVLCMLAGCVLTSGLIGGARFNAWGIALGVMSGVSYSIYTILAKLEMRWGCNPMTASLYCFLVVSVISFSVCKPGEVAGLAAQNLLVTFPLVLGLGICTCVLPYFLYTLALKSLPAGTAAAMGILEPMSATAFGVILFHEPLGLPSVCGMILILGSVFLLSKNDLSGTQSSSGCKNKNNSLSTY